MTEAPPTPSERCSLLRLVCCKCWRSKVLRVQVLPACEPQRKKTVRQIVESADSQNATANLSKRTIALHIPLKDHYVDSECSIGASRRDSSQSMPNKPLHQERVILQIGQSMETQKCSTTSFVPVRISSNSQAHNSNARSHSIAI